MIPQRKKFKPQFFRQMKDDITKIDDVTYYVKSSQPDHEPYMVFNSINKGWICDCMNDTFKPGDECRHIQDVQKSLQSNE